MVGCLLVLWLVGLLALQCCSWWFVGTAVSDLLALQSVVYWHGSWWFAGTAVGGLLALWLVVIVA